ncbi:gamma-glutamyl-gamma-aminobutyrate hydrolase family protein [Dactylosporangium aurantiacum]|uniref:Gamma-glutamyl-gamma-aminobutyrate hydrolase family protein n=1 Tax=Dactylosporangium aurantiacum TaxID=35754 RepID=A0A9Q9IDY1_9ACTN|nr:gamma-glutamyl-gamma-aminobutyrate hydrolase family protein [Dactylosporangium aurantiacum]MDG6106630.1 gamma-glutamyl-gamma-aminobutyrate hydrolase family protein [Dactylosporangium aurantiacum]UWZ50790.1 gamma-glutamyl-gamma-aminobutyrate hydrolase family protein [Dactylosporangium aurantiacum]
MVVLNQPGTGPAPARTAGSAPVIGISAHSGPIHVAVFDITATFAASQFVDGVAAAGGRPVLLPPLPGIESVVRRLDGLLLLPGPDVDPALYAADRHPSSRGINPDRDLAELALLEAALNAGTPVLGICRGAQLLNVLRGGTLHQHLPELVGHDRHLPAGNGYGDEPIVLDPSSRLGQLLGVDELTVPCHHHQGIDKVGFGIEPSAWAADGVIEAIEVAGQDFAVGVQWHAERGGASKELFSAFVDVCRLNGRF